jgi:hypothetical protein
MNVNIGIDRVIFQLINKPYTEMSSFKLKRAVINAIDFKIFFDTSTNSFILYLRGDKHDLLTNSKKLPRINDRSIKVINVNLQDLNYLPKALDILFASPYYEHLDRFYVDSDFDKTNYTKDEINTVNNLISKLKDDPIKFKGQILEFSLTHSKKLVPYKIRNDKPYANGYKIGLSNIEPIFCPLQVKIHISIIIFKTMCIKLLIL